MRTTLQPHGPGDEIIKLVKLFPADRAQFSIDTHMLLSFAEHTEVGLAIYIRYKKWNRVASVVQFKMIEKLRYWYFHN